MPKYAEGAVSPSGKYVVRGGRWVSVDGAESDVRSVSAAPMFGADPMMPGASATRVKKVTPGEGAAIVAGTAAAAPLAMAPYAATAVASPVGRAALTWGGTKAFEKATGVDVPWYAETAIDAATGGTAVKGASGLLKALLRLGLKGEIKGVAKEGAKKGAEAAAKTLTKKAANETSKLAIQGLKRPLSQESLQIVSRLQGLMRTQSNRAAIKQAVKQSFGEDWEPIWNFLKTSHTRI